MDLQLPVQSVFITTKVLSSNPVHGEEYSIQHYVIKFVSDLRQVSGFLWFPHKTDHHDITEILLKVALSTINQPTFVQLDHAASLHKLIILGQRLENNEEDHNSIKLL